MTIYGGWNSGEEQVTAGKLRLASILGLAGTTPLGVTGGVRMSHADALEVTAGVSGLTTSVAPGLVVVPGTESTAQAAYWIASDDDETVTLATADGTHSRIDRVIARVVDTGSETTTYTIEPLTGTPAPSPVAPSLPANSLSLSRVTVPALADSPGDLTIVDERVPLEVLAAPPRLLGHAQTDGDFIFVSGPTAWVDVSDLSLTVSVPAGVTRLRMSFCARMGYGASGANMSELVFREGSTELRNTANWRAQAQGGPGQTEHTFFRTIPNPTAGTHTYKVSARRTAGSGAFTVYEGAEFTVEILQ